MNLTPSPGHKPPSGSGALPFSGHRGSLTHDLYPVVKMLVPHITAAPVGAEEISAPVAHSAFGRGDEDTQAVLTPSKLCCALWWGCIKARAFGAYCLSQHPKIQGADSSPASASAAPLGPAQPRADGESAAALPGLVALLLSSGTPSQGFPQRYISILLYCLILSGKPQRKSRAHRSQSSVFSLLFSVL